MRRLPLSVVLVLTLLGQACENAVALSEATLAAAPPLPYRIALVGGAFLPPSVRDDVGFVPEPTPGGRQIYSRTYPTGVAEPISFETIRDLLVRGRAATTLLPGAAGEEERERLAAAGAEELRAAREVAAGNGADLMLVIEGLEEGPVEMHGVTGQWPVTTVAWLLVGLGMFIPDHRFESKVRLIASLRDVHSDRVLVPIGVVPGTMDLALVSRARFLGILASLIVPPTLVANSVDKVVRVVRQDGDRRLLLRLLARLKDSETLEMIRARLPMRLTLRAVAKRTVEVELESVQEVQNLAIEIVQADGRLGPLAADPADAFRRSFVGSVRKSDNAWRYTSRLGGLDAGAEVRVLVQSVAGQRVSSTIRLEP